MPWLYNITSGLALRAWRPLRPPFHLFVCVCVGGFKNRCKDLRTYIDMYVFVDFTYVKVVFTKECSSVSMCGSTYSSIPSKSENNSRTAVGGVGRFLGPPPLGVLLRRSDRERSPRFGWLDAWELRGDGVLGERWGEEGRLLSALPAASLATSRSHWRYKCANHEPQTSHTQATHRN